jgi:hypothetical protein
VRHAARRLAWVCAGVLVATNGVGANAQSARHGVRLEYASIGTQGGLSGRAFLPLSSRDVALMEDGGAPAPGCPPTPRIRATARLPRGAVREVSLEFALRAPTTLPLNADRCPEANVHTRLEDDSVLHGGRGEITVTGYTPPDAIPGLVVGTFSQTVLRAGAPVTVRGEFRVPLPLAIGIPRDGENAR